MRTRNDYRTRLKALTDENLLKAIKILDEASEFDDDFRYTSTPALTKYNYAVKLAKERGLM